MFSMEDFDDLGPLINNNGNNSNSHNKDKDNINRRLSKETIGTN